MSGDQYKIEPFLFSFVDGSMFGVGVAVSSIGMWLGTQVTGAVATSGSHAVVIVWLLAATTFFFTTM